MDFAANFIEFLHRSRFSSKTPASSITEQSFAIDSTARLRGLCCKTVGLELIESWILGSPENSCPGLVKVKKKYHLVI